MTVTFSLAFEQVSKNSAAAADLVRLFAFLAADAIPEEVFREGAEHLGEELARAAAEPLQFIEALKEAGRFSLVGAQPRGQDPCYAPPGAGSRARTKWMRRRVEFGPSAPSTP